MREGSSTLKSSTRASVMSTTHTAHSDQANQAAVRCLIGLDSSSLSPCPLCHNPTLQHYRLPSVTANVTKQNIQGELRRMPLPRTPVNEINIARLGDAPRFLEIVGCPWLQQRIEDL